MTESALYVFLVQRPVDSYSWPAVYTDLKLAETAYGRISTIKTVEFTMDDLVATNAPEESYP
jgi:hypothetical protein